VNTPWIGLPPKSKPAGRVVRPLADDDEPVAADPTKPEIRPFLAGDAKGDLQVTKEGYKMPRGVYERKPRGEAAEPGTEKKARKRKVPRRAKPLAKSNGPRFWLGEDGSVQLELPKCKGELTSSEAKALVEFIRGRKGRA